MIEVLFSFGGEILLVKVEGEKVKFSNAGFGLIETDISGLRLSYEGVIKEFPDLKDDKDWKNKVIQRFKDHIKSLKTEEERVNYIIDDLKKHGYLAKYKQRKGFRREVVKE